MCRIITHLALGPLTLVALSACGTAEQPSAQTGTSPIASRSTSSSLRPSTTPKIGEHSTILTIRTRGGRCVYGECWSEKQIKVDGSFTAADGTGAQKNGTLDAAKVAELTEQIANADFEQIKAQPFTGTCPSAVDGQEYIYTFQTLSGPETIESCAVAIDENSPLFQNITALIAMVDQG